MRNIIFPFRSYDRIRRELLLFWRQSAVSGLRSLESPEDVARRDRWPGCFGRSTIRGHLVTRIYRRQISSFAVQPKGNIG